MARGDVADDRHVEHLLLAEEPHRPALPRDQVTRWPAGRSSSGGCRRGSPAPSSGMLSRPSMSKRTHGNNCGCASTMQRLLRLDPDELRHARRHVEVHDRPAPDRGDAEQARIGVDRVRVADHRQQRDVVVAVGVGEACATGRRRCGRPVARPRAPCPCPRRTSPSIVPSYVAVGTAVAGGDHVVDAEPFGQRRDQVDRGGRGHDHRSGRRRGARRSAAGVRQHVLGAAAPRRSRRPRAPGRAPNPVRHPGALAGEEHRRPGLADEVEDLEDQPTRSRSARSGSSPTCRSASLMTGPLAPAAGASGRDRRTRHRRNRTIRSSRATYRPGTAVRRRPKRPKDRRGAPVLQEGASGRGGQTVDAGTRGTKGGCPRPRRMCC